jgi:AcrR family transcriptional regulator
VASFSLLTAHGTALAELATNPGARPADVAEALGVSERAAQRIVADLVDAGYVTRTQNGRRAYYDVTAGLPITFRNGATWKAPDAGEHETTREPTPREEVRDKLLAAAERIIDDELTYFELTVDQLVREAGISRATFYANFQDIEALLQAVITPIFDELATAAELWTDLPANLTREDLLTAMRAVIDIHQKHTFVMSAASSAGSSRAGLQAQYEALMQRTARSIEAHISRGQRAGFVRAELDAASTATLITWGVERRLGRAGNLLTAADRRRVASSLTDMLWEVLYAGRA